MNVVDSVTCVLRPDLWMYTPSTTSRAQEVIQLLKQSKCPLLLGIWGMPGIGKSTIAKAIYEQIDPYFEGKCFLKVGDVWEQNHGQVSLQKKIILDIDKATEIEIPTIESGREILKERLRHKRVLLVLDDVNKLEQLNALCRSREWFGAGSKITITTKDRQLLNEHGVDHIYRVKELDESESLAVFNLGAFSQETTPGEDFGKLSRQLVAYCGRLPLALEKLGSFFNGHEALQWDGVLRSPEGFSIPVQ
ncbi:NBS-containing resistance-like protein [Trifolium pratense]|uniref:NBS-containing resistance-like protein n=1 Tax=Trifolium pratense TaxID=57577 RepID=A0A2K3MDN8_TRIPR|nr:NBS-containing resistance-like protein [Trifolium pratense]